MDEAHPVTKVTKLLPRRPARRRRRHAPRSALRRAIAWIVLVVFHLAPPGLPAASAAPRGERVVHGRADFERAGDVTNITTHSRRTVIRYSGFDIAPHETVNITQPTRRSAVLNEVRSTRITRLDGTLWSNGRVWIVNPVGVYVGGQAVVDVGGLVAAAGNVDEGDFLGGVQRFRDLRGRVEVEQGARIAAADSVLLVGREVANYGSIRVPDGTIALVAGGSVRLARVGGRVIVDADPAAAPDPDRYAVTQAGTLDAGRGAVHLTAGDGYSLAMNHTGITRARQIEAEGGAGGVVDVAGTLDASGQGAGDTGGTIHVLGDRIALRDATLDASGDAGGGDIRVGGDVQGQGPLRTASRTFVSDDAVLRADAGTGGDGGTIVVWADDATRFYGEASARGGAERGDGGFVEISGRSLVAPGHVALGAAHGKSGTLLYDPDEIEIHGGTADGTDADLPDDVANTFLRGDASANRDGKEGEIADDDVGAPAEGEPAEPFKVYESELEGTDANIVLQARKGVTTTGTFGNGDVVIREGNDLTIEVTGTDADGNAVDISGVNLRPDGTGDLVWKLSDGGRFVLTTNGQGDPETTTPRIVVDAVETQGVRAGDTVDGRPAVDIEATGAADITVGRIDTRGTDREGADAVLDPSAKDYDPDLVENHRGGGVFVKSDRGDIAVGSVVTRGGDAADDTEAPTLTDVRRGDGGTGGAVDIEALAGRLDVGDVDTSGGTAHLRVVEDENGNFSTEGIGGAAGTLALVTGERLRSASDASGPPPSSLDIHVTGDLVARGGEGLGEVTLPETGSAAASRHGAQGGAGGGIFLSAGVVEGEAAEPATPLGAVFLEGSEPVTPDDAVGSRIDASGGGGTAGGGQAAVPGGLLLADQSVLDTGAITLEAAGNVATQSGTVQLLARGGDAGADGGPGGLGGNGSSVSLTSTHGSIDLGAGPAGDDAIVTDGGTGIVPGTGRLEGQGGAAGAVALKADGDVVAFGGIRARGGEGNHGNGGAGGKVTYDATGGVVWAGAVDASGGNGTGSVQENVGAGIAAAGAHGGAGGTIELLAGVAEAGVEPPPGGPWDIALLGNLTTAGGTGVATPRPEGETPDDLQENNGLGGTVHLETEGVVGSGPAPFTTSANVRAHAVEIDAGSIADGTSGVPLVLASVGSTEPADAEDTVDVAVSGAASFRLSDADRFDRLTIAQADASQGVDVVRDVGGSPGAHIVRAEADGMDATRHVIRELTTDDADPHVTYRLVDSAADDEDGNALLLDRRTLVVDSGAVAVGAKGAKIANARLRADGSEELLGRVEGAGAGPHVTTGGNLELLGTSVGGQTDGAKLDLQRTGAATETGVELTVAGDVDLQATGFARLDIEQRRTAGDVDVALESGDASGDGDEVTIAGADIPGGADPIALAKVEKVDTASSGTQLFYSLTDETGGGYPREEPVLSIAADAVRLGADAGFASTGDLVLESETDAPAIDAGGHTLALLADADLDGGGALQGSGQGTDVANAAGLVLLAGEGVGSEATPLQVSGSGGDVTVAGSAGEDGFHLANGAGDLVIAPVGLTVQNDGETQTVSFRGLHSGGDADTGGDVDLDNGGPDSDGTIVLGAIGPDDPVDRVLSRPGLAVTGVEDGDAGVLRVGFGGFAFDPGDLQTSGTAAIPHVVSTGDQRYGGDVVLANARAYASTDPDTGDPVVAREHAVTLEAGGDVVFEGNVDVDTSAEAHAVFTPDEEQLQDGLMPVDEFVAGSLTVDAAGTTVFHGDVGTPGTFDTLVTNAARFEGLDGGTHHLELARADFRGAVDGLDGPDGPDALEIRAVSLDPDTASRVTFRGDVGAADALQGLDVDADAIEFGAGDAGSADRVVTGDGGIWLNGATPHDPGDVPPTATIFDTGGGLSLETTGGVGVGANGLDPDAEGYVSGPEKLSVIGPLSIRAGQGVSVGDLSATSLRIHAPSIVIHGRDPGPVELPNGATRTDRGVDWVANDIRTNVTPAWDGVGLRPNNVGARPTFVLGSGGIDLGGGRLPFEAIRFEPGGQAVTVASLVGPDGVLDLTGTGRPVVADPTRDVPRPLPRVTPALAARFSDTEPVAPPSVSDAKLLAYLGCRAPSGGPCDPEEARQALDMPSFGESALATARAREIAADVQALLGRPDGPALLVAAFRPVEAAYRRAAATGPVDGAALYRLVAGDPALAPAHAKLDRLARALAQVELLGMAPDDTARARRALAAAFAEAAGMSGLDADAVLAAVDASRIGQLR